MKNQNKRGFTLVELVIVIAVIAILAGVMIATFASVVNDAKESAALQEAQQAELAQKIDDVTKKLENPNWLTWEDFENELAEQLADINTNTPELTEATVKAVVEAALNEYAAKNANKETGITEEQINAIVERTLAGSMTQAQVESIVKKYAANNLTAAQVSSIVNNAMASNLTAAEVRQVVAAELAGIEVEISKIKNNALTEDQVSTIVAGLLEKYGSVVSEEVEDGESFANIFDTTAEGYDAAATVVTLNKDIEVDASLTIAKNTTIDLNGNTLNLDEKLIIAENVTVTIANGTVANENGRAIEVSGNVSIENAVVTGGLSDGTATLKVAGNAVLMVENATVEGASYALYAADTSTLIVDNGTFEGPTPIGMNNNMSPNAKMVINGGTYIGTSAESPVIFWPAGTLEINGGKFVAENTLAAICGGTVTINGGEFVSNETATTADQGNSGPYVDNASVFAIIADRTPDSDSYTIASVTISKDVVISANTFADVAVYAQNVTTEDGAEYTVEANDFVFPVVAE